MDVTGSDEEDPSGFGNSTDVSVIETAFEFDETFPDEDWTIYQTAIEDGFCLQKNLRLLILGNNGVGKTTLSRNIVGESVKNVKSTNGIDVNIQKYIIDETTFEITKIQFDDVGEVQRKYLSQIYDEFYEKGKQKAGTKDPGFSSSFNIRKRNETDTVKQHLIAKTSGEEKEIKTDKIFMSLWDFGGETIFYNSHHIFLNNNAVYIVVFNIKKCLTDPKEIEAVIVWLQSIATYTRTDETGKHHCPPVILVGTHLDRTNANEAEKVIKRICESKEIKHVLQHLDYHLVDNKKPRKYIRNLLRDVVKLAPLQAQWKKPVLAKWLSLEMQILNKKTQGFKILSDSNVYELNKRMTSPIVKEQIKDFLDYLHLSGTILYSGGKGIVDVHYVEAINKLIIDPQWIIDAFRCLITAPKFIDPSKKKLFMMWPFYQASGKLTLEIIDEAWAEVQVKHHPKHFCCCFSEDLSTEDSHDNNTFLKHKGILLAFMEKTGLIAKPIQFTTSETCLIKDNQYYIVPCMLPDDWHLFMDILEDDKHLVKSRTLCFGFGDLLVPFPIFDKLIAASIAKYELYVLDKRNELTALKRHLCIFRLDAKWNFILFWFDHILTATLFTYDNKNTVPPGTGIEVREFLDNTLIKIIHLYRHFQLKYDMFLYCKMDPRAENILHRVTDIQRHTNLPCCDGEKRHFITADDLLPWYEKSAESKGDELVNDLPRANLAPATSQQKFKKQLDDTLSIRVHDLIAECAKAVGIIRTDCINATGFRVGANYIMTASHVLEEIRNKHVQCLGATSVNPVQLATIQFGFKQQNQPSTAVSTFYLDQVCYENQDLDVAIVSLKPDSSKTLPVPIEYLANIMPNELLYLIGHPDGEPMKCDPKIELRSPNSSDVFSAIQWGRRYRGQDEYVGIFHPGKVIFDCIFENGASGSPGIMITNLNKPVVVMMYVCGYPKFYHTDLTQQQQQQLVPKEHLIEQAVTMEAIYEDMKMKINLDTLRMDVFGQ